MDNDTKRDIVALMLFVTVVVIVVAYAAVFVIQEVTKPDGVRYAEAVQAMQISPDEAQSATLLAEAAKTQAEAEQIAMETINAGVMGTLINLLCALAVIGIPACGAVGWFALNKAMKG